MRITTELARAVEQAAHFIETVERIVDQLGTAPEYGRVREWRRKNNADLVELRRLMNSVRANTTLFPVPVGKGGGV